MMADNSKSIEDEILEFNNDPDVFALRNRYTTKTFLDIMSVSRSENRHSAFLAWLFKGDDFAVAPQDHPIVHLLDIMIKRVGENDNVKDDTLTKKNIEVLPTNKISNYGTLKDIVLTRDIQSIEVIEASTEKTLKDLCGIPTRDNKDRDKTQFPSNDRIDIYLKCRICKNSDRMPLDIEFIIENKIGSTEGGEYTKKGTRTKIDGDYRYYGLTQTQRYFLANAERTDKEEKLISSYIFLSPDNQTAKSPYFINISYQDILNSVIEPLLLPEVNISDRIRVLIEEYISSLSLPAYEQSDDLEKKEKQIKNALIMAVRKDEEEKLNTVWQKFYTNNGLLKEVIANSLTDKEDNSELLRRFYEVNKSLIIALLRVAIERKEKTKDEGNDEQLEELKNAYQNMLPKQMDRSKFTITFTDSRPIGSLGKGKLFFEIAKRYIKKYAEDKEGKLVEPREYFMESAFKDLTLSSPIVIHKTDKNGNHSVSLLSTATDGGKEVTKEYTPKEFNARFMKEDGKVKVIKGKKGEQYIISSQWGIGEVFYNLLKFLGISRDDFMNKQSGESNDSNLDIYKKLGIKSISWKH